MAKTRKSSRIGREVICTDARKWLPTQTNLASIVTSIPEMDEVKLNEAEYDVFFRDCAKKCLVATSPSGYCIFLQTDRKRKGWIDKSYLISNEAHALGYKMMWHKIALRQEVGTSGLFRPTYSHMLCYSKKGKPGKVFPDVMDRGDVTYENGFGIQAVHQVLQFLKVQGVKTVVDPFVGSGTTLALANDLGLHAIGVDIDPKQCKKAKTLAITFPTEKNT